MATQLAVKPGQNGTLFVELSPTDDNNNALSIGDLITPQWQLMRIDGTVVNERTFENSTLTSLEVTLTGDDLAIFGVRESGRRIFSFQAKYISGGKELNTTAEVEFTIQELKGQVNQ